MCNTVRNAATSPFVTQPQRNGNPDPTRPDPTQVLSGYDSLRIAQTVTRGHQRHAAQDRAGT